MSKLCLRCLAFSLAVTVAACGGDDAELPAVDAAIDPDAAAAVDAAIDAVPGPDADPSLEPSLTVVPCNTPAAMIEYYSCAFFIGGGALRVGDEVQFIGCDGHAVRSAAGVTLTEGFTPVCYRVTSPGTLSYACQQHPNNTGSVTVEP